MDRILLHTAAATLLGLSMAAHAADDVIAQLERLDRGADATIVATLTERAAAGDRDAQYWLGRYLHDLAPLTERDFQEARSWLERASTAGHLRATVMLARIHETGFIVSQDREAASRYYERALDQGSADAGYDLARIEFAKDDRDGAAVVRYLSAAAELGHRQSTVDLGFLHAAGTLGAVDGEAAVYWARRGVALGEARSMNLLARLYANGIGVEPDAAEALKWAILARDHGDADGAEVAREIAAAVPEEVQLEARARALAWRESNGGQ